MEYSNRIYAKALLKALENKTSQEQKEIFKNFIEILNKKKVSARLAAIIEELKKQYYKKRNLRNVKIESATPVNATVKNEIVKFLGSEVLFSEKIDSSILAGIKILIDEEILINASAKKQINKMFLKS